MLPAFSGSYQEARQRFLAACAAQDLPVWSHANPAPGPGGIELATDIARIGPDDAEAVLVVESGLHGVEGYAGSGIQVGLLIAPDAPRPAAGVALLLVHAINPYGFAWNRRFNEDNIDLNRHFVDWDNPGRLDNPGYDALADAIVPPALSGPARAEAEAALARYAAEHGDVALRQALKRGQYSHPDGIFYGGRAPSWSALRVAAICREHLGRARRAGLIDIHTGLGPFGYGECLSPAAPDSVVGRRATAWYGPVAHTMNPETGYAGSQASIIHGYERAAPWLDWTAIGLEFGTRPSLQVRDAVRADGWLHRHGGPDHPDRDRIKRELIDAFYPAEPEWREMVLKRGLEVVGRGLDGLAAG